MASLSENGIDHIIAEATIQQMAPTTPDYIVQDMRQAGVANPKGVVFTVNSKQEMAQILRQRMTQEQLRIPYDRDLLDELNVEKYTLTKAGRITYSHPEGTHDDRFWALALAVYAADQVHPTSRPIARTI